MRYLAFALLSLLGLSSAALAQGSVVVAACPSAVQLYSAGQTNRVPAIDIYGTACASGSGGGGGSSNITQWGSATLGAATGWGTAPTGNVPGVNANNFAANGLTSGAMQLDAFGNLRVANVPFPLFTDLFNGALDTTTNWTTNNSGGTAAVSAGALVVSGTTTASQYGGLSTKNSFSAPGVGTTIFAGSVVYNTLAVSNSVRLFGQYTSPATPTLAAPVTDGYLFRLNASGSLFAEIWSAGASVFSADITAVAGCAPSTTTPVVYYAQFRINAVFFGCGLNSNAAVSLNVAPSNQMLPLSAYSIAGLSNPGSAATMSVGGATVVTTNPAAVKSAGQAANINDPAIVTTPSPNGTQPTSSSDIGAKADATCGTGTGSCSLIQLIKFLNSQITSSIPTGSNLIGSVSIDQTTPGTTNKVSIDQTTPGTTNAVTATGSVAGASADSGNPVKIGGKYNSTRPTYTDGQRTDTQSDTRGNTGVVLFAANSSSSFGVVATPSTGSALASYLPGFAAPALAVTSTTFDPQFSCNQSAVVNVTAGNTTELVALTASQTVRVCTFSVSISLTGTAQFVYGTGTNCGTGTTNLTGVVPLTTGTPWSVNGGASSMFRTASANALCLTAVTGNVIGFVTYAKF